MQHSKNNAGWTGYYILTRTLKGFSLLPNSSTQESWIQIFYEKFYSLMMQGHIYRHDQIERRKNIQLSVKCRKQLFISIGSISKKAIISSEIFRGIPPLETANKLDAILLHLSIYYSHFKNIEQFLDRLPSADRYEFAVEF